MLKAWRLALPAALTLALLLATKEYVTGVVRGEVYPFLHTFRMTAPPAVVWALLVPLVGHLARRYPLHGRRAVVGVATHVVLGMLIVLGYTLACIAVMYPFGWFPFLEPLPRTIRLGFVFLLPTSLIYYSLTLAVYHALAYYRGLQAREVLARELEARLVRARLEGLRAQLHPHFLFNALHAVSALVTEDPLEAERMLARLSELLRLSLREDPAQLVPLERELEVLELYLAIQRVRFQDRLEVEVSIPEGARKLLVPHWILQPLVENAIRHGIAPAERAGRVEVQAECMDGALQLRVSDDGLGAPGADAVEERIGLSNTRMRLHQLYGQEQRMTITTAPDQGFRVTIEVPAREGRAA
jgi:two-component system, LytTR family, sensor kinase